MLFAYDGRNRCVKRVEIQNGLGRTTFMVWGHEPSQGWGLLEERGPNGELLARHVHGPSIDDLVLSELNGAVHYYHEDHLNSTVAVADENGNVVEQYRYDVYGQPYFYGPDGTPRSESPLGIRFLFTGREWRSSLALYDYRHRLYSPSLGRFLQMDPLGFAAGNVNVYGCCANNPINSIDPLGLCEESGRPWWRSLIPDGQYITVVVNLGAFGAAPFGVSIFKNDAQRKIGIYGVEGFSLGWQGPYIQASLGNVHRAPTLANYAGGTASFDAAGGPFGMLGLEVGHGQTKGFSLFDPPTSGSDLALSPNGAVTYGLTVGLSALPGLNVSATSATYHKAPLPSWAESALWWIVSLSPF